MRYKPALLWGIVIVGFVLVVILTTALLTPQATNPAYVAALNFVNAAGKGDDVAASAELSPELLAWVAQNCPDASVAACVDAYTPPEWGAMLSAVFRRAMPVAGGQTAWDVQLVATYAEEQGFSGVCIYVRSAKQADDTWQVVRWSGWVSCDEPNAGLSDLMGDDAPHRAP